MMNSTAKTLQGSVQRFCLYGIFYIISSDIHKNSLMYMEDKTESMQVLKSLENIGQKVCLPAFLYGNGKAVTKRELKKQRFVVDILREI